MSIRVLIADDQALVRAGLRMILDGAPGIEVVGEAVDGRSAVDRTVATRPHVVLMDIRMPVVDGIEATRRIVSRSAGKNARILILTTFDLDEYVVQALKAGASGFLLKDALAADLIAAVRTVAAGDAVVGPTITRRLLERFLETSSDPAGIRVFDVLTPRERDVLEQIARGFSNLEIAHRLSMSEGTVKTHVGRILSKLELRDRVNAVVLAYEAGMVKVGSGLK